MKNLTELEIAVIEAIKLGDEFEEMPTVCLKELVYETKLSTKILRGVLGSLFKKDLLLEGEYPDGDTAYHYNGN